MDPYAYHFDLRAKPLQAGGNLAERLGYLARITADPSHTNPVTVIQLGLGTLQLRDQEQLPLVAGVVDWLKRAADNRGLLAYRFPMPHTYRLRPPWYSSLAQGEAGSLLVRAAEIFGRGQLMALADRFVEPLLGVDSFLVAETPEGGVLQEYPTNPPAHVLNGWITSLFGLYDVAHAQRDSSATGARKASEVFETGAAVLAARLHLYRTPVGWSRYDLYPHPLPNTASLAYHRLHVSQLRSLYSLTGLETFAATADEWERSLSNPAAVALGFVRKAAFRVVRPRSRLI